MITSVEQSSTSSENCIKNNYCIKINYDMVYRTIHEDHFVLLCDVYFESDAEKLYNGFVASKIVDHHQFSFFHPHHKTSVILACAKRWSGVLETSNWE